MMQDEPIPTAGADTESGTDQDPVVSDCAGSAPRASEGAVADSGVSTDSGLAVDFKAHPDWAVWSVSALTFVNGLTGLVHILLSRPIEHRHLTTVLLPAEMYDWSRSASLAFSFALIYLSFKLVGRKRAAWWLALGASFAAAVAHLLRSHVAFESIGPLVAMAVLIALRPRFTVKSEPKSIWHGAQFMLFSILGALAYGTAGFWLLDRKDFGIDFHLSDAFIRTLREFTLVGNGDLVAHTRQGRWFLNSLDVLGVVAGSCAFYSLFRPLAYRLHTLPHEKEQLKKILSMWGKQSLDFYKLLSDKSYFFSEDKQSCIAFRTAQGVAIALGDPVGPPDKLQNLTFEFRNYCHDNGWRVAFLQVLSDLLPMYRHLGLSVLKVGEEAVIDVDHFVNSTLVTHKEFARKSRKFEKDGYKCERLLPRHSDELLDELEAVSNEWLSLPGRRERTFSLGVFERNYIAETPVFVVRNPDGKIIAFVNEVPAYRKGEASIDLMRHRVEIPNGAMDYLFHQLLLCQKNLGFSDFNLGLAALAGVGGEPGATLEEEAIHQIYEHLNRFFSYKGLRTYKAKFEPNWEDRYLVYEFGPPGLVKTAVALAKVGEID